VHYSYKHRRFRSVILHPAIIKEFQNNWYVTGYSENHGEMRTFGLDRVYDPAFVKKAFIACGQKVSNEYFKHLYGVYPLPGRKMETIEFAASPMMSDFLHAHPIHDSQQRVVEAGRGMAKFLLKLVPSQELLQFFLSYPDLTVMKPSWLAQELSLLHQKAIRNARHIQ
jgi:predicted DNA-binding transcriptional regulator YafY